MSIDQSASPRWSSGTKLVAGLTLVAIIAALLIRFNNLIVPLLLAFILSYLLHPLVNQLAATAKVTWRAAVNLVFFAFLIVIIILLVLLGFAIVDQMDTLVRFIQNFISGLPEFAGTLSTAEAVQFGPFEINFAELERLLITEFEMDFSELSRQLLTALQPAIGQAGSVVGALAASALTTIGWAFFVFLISYFLLAEAGQVPTFFKNVDLPGHDADLRRMGRELGRIWNAFLRGQLVLIIMIIFTSFLLMSALGVHNALALAFLTGAAKFVPYLGPLIAGLVTALVAYFQGGNYLGIEPPLTYAIIVVVSSVVLDQIFDNLVTPRIYGEALGVHPAAVLVAALIAASLLGLVGLLLAAPVLASLQLFATYAIRKMVDLDPWPDPESDLAPIEVPLARPLQGVWQRFREYVTRLRKRGKQ
jgi:predicted PurR-regulated permease PerM